MRILYIVPYVPNQIRIRPYSLLKGLRERGHQVTLATLWSSNADRLQLEALKSSGLNVIAAPLPRSKSLLNALQALPSQTPLQSVYCWQPRLLQAVQPLVARAQFEIIHVEHLRGANYGLALQNAGIPVVWDSVDCISYLFEQAAVRSRSLFGKWITRLELGRTRSCEGRLAHRFDTVLVTSEVDRQALIRLAQQVQPEHASAFLPGKVRVLPNGVDQGYFSPNGRHRDTETLVLSGKMSYHANVTMALHLVQDIMPLVWAQRPQVKVSIVGQNPPPAVKKLCKDPRVTVTGFVPDMRPYLQQATVAVVPSAYGAGIQNKVLEAMACGTPVVASEPATAALNLEKGRDLLVANTAHVYCEQVLRLLDSEPLRHTVGLNGLNYVRREHHWSQIVARLEAIYQHLADCSWRPQQPALPSLAQNYER